MDLRNALFGYISGRFENEPAKAMLLSEDGLLVYEQAGGKRASFSVSGDCLGRVRDILSQNMEELRQCAAEINHVPSALPPDGENCFIFGDLVIIDWDLTRWYLEEDRKKHPDYYSNSVKVELTETRVRAVFDEICAVIEADEKKMRYARLML